MGVSFEHPCALPVASVCSIGFFGLGSANLGIVLNGIELGFGSVNGFLLSAALWMVLIVVPCFLTMGVGGISMRARLLGLCAASCLDVMLLLANTFPLVLFAHLSLFILLLQWFLRREAHGAISAMIVALSLASMHLIPVDAVVLIWSANACTYVLKNSVFVGVVSGVLAVAVLALVELLEATSRGAAGKGSGCCEKCDYDLTGNVSGVCPECGTPVGQDQRKHYGQTSAHEDGSVE